MMCSNKDKRIIHLFNLLNTLGQVLIQIPHFILSDGGIYQIKIQPIFQKVLFYLGTYSTILVARILLVQYSQALLWIFCLIQILVCIFMDSMICLSSSHSFLCTLVGVFSIKSVLKYSFAAIKIGYKDITEK